jgi:hypothetical protein
MYRYYELSQPDDVKVSSLKKLELTIDEKKSFNIEEFNACFAVLKKTLSICFGFDSLLDYSWEKSFWEKIKSKAMFLIHLSVSADPDIWERDDDNYLETLRLNSDE